MPQRRGGAGGRIRRRERDDADHQDAGADQPEETNRPGDRLGRVAAPASHFIRLRGVGAGEQRAAGARRRFVEQGGQRASPPGTQLLQPAGDPGLREIRERSPGHPDDGQERQHHGDPGDQDPLRRAEPTQPRGPRRGADHHGGGAGGECQPAGSSLDPERSGETPQGQARGRSGHSPYPTAYANRFTPMRSAASCFSGGSRWTSGSSHPSPRSVWYE